MPEHLRPHLKEVLLRCERQARHTDADKAYLHELFTLGLIRPRRDVTRGVIYQLTYMGEKALMNGWY